MAKKGFATVNSFSNTFTINEGLRSYMIGIYNYMTIALMMSAVIAFFSAKSGLTMAIFSSPFGIIVSLAPIGISMYTSIKFHKMSVSDVRNSLLLYSATMGLSLSTIFLVFRFSEITTAFFATASMFAGMSIYGHLTKKDLSSLGSILLMTIWGLLIASLINIFTGSSQLSLMISLIAVVAFSLLVAFDTQKLKQLYYMIGESDSDMSKKVAIFGATQLYMDFVAIFVHLLHLLRSVRDN